MDLKNQGGINHQMVAVNFSRQLPANMNQYLCKNLRDSVPAIIAIDVPENGDYHFSCMQTSADSDN